MRLGSAFYTNSRMIGIVWMLATLGALSMSGCSGLFYQPTRRFYRDPGKHAVPFRNLWLATEDGVRLHAWLFSPPNPKGRIIFFHGNGENLTSHWTSLAWILDHQFEFLIFDYRGYGISSGRPDRQGTFLDGKAALKWGTLEEPKLPLFILGQSLGGAIAIKTAADWGCQADLRGIAVDSTFASYQRVAQRLMAQSKLLWLFQWLSYLLVSNDGAPEDVIKNVSPIPLMVLHGDADRVVAFENGQEVFEQAKEPKLFVPVSGGAHIDAFWRVDEPYRDLFVQWLNRRLQDNRPPSRRCEVWKT